eukprot:246-Pyramimonas_sp.AAC.1
MSPAVLLTLVAGLGCLFSLKIPTGRLCGKPPRMLALRRSRDCVETRLDQCQFKAPWKKAARIVAWRSSCLSRLSLRCKASGR